MKGLPYENPFKIEKFSEIRTPKYIPPEKDYWAIVKAAETEQDELMLLCYLHLAARKTEILILKWSDINFLEKKICLYTRKRRDGSLEYDWLPMTDFLYVRFKDFFDKNKDRSEYVFPSPITGLPYFDRKRWMKRLCRLAGVNHFGLHAIRHLSASILMKNDVPLIDIKTILRHKNLSTTERYIHRLKSVRESINVLPSYEKSEEDQSILP